MTEKIRCALYSIMYSIMGIALGIIEKSGAWYGFLDDTGSYYVDEAGEQVRFQGKAKFIEYLLGHKEVTNIFSHNNSKDENKTNS